MQVSGISREVYERLDIPVATVLGFLTLVYDVLGMGLDRWSECGIL